MCRRFEQRKGYSSRTARVLLQSLLFERDTGVRGVARHCYRPSISRRDQISIFSSAIAIVCRALLIHRRPSETRKMITKPSISVTVTSESTATSLRGPRPIDPPGSEDEEEIPHEEVMAYLKELREGTALDRKGGGGKSVRANMSINCTVAPVEDHSDRSPRVVRGNNFWASEDRVALAELGAPRAIYTLNTIAQPATGLRKPS